RLERALAALTGDPGLGAARDRELFPPPAADELILAFHPLTRGGWAVFAADATGVAFRRFSLPAAAGNSPTTAWKAALGEQVLAPFADRLRRARRVRLLPYGALAEVD